MVKQVSKHMRPDHECQKSSPTSLLTNSPAKKKFLESTENWTLQIQHKNHVLFVYHFLESLLPTSQVPMFSSPPSPHSCVQESWVQASSSPCVFEALRSKSHIPVPLLVTAKIQIKWITFTQILILCNHQQVIKENFSMLLAQGSRDQNVPRLFTCV